MIWPVCSATPPLACDHTRPLSPRTALTRGLRNTEVSFLGEAGAKGDFLSADAPTYPTFSALEGQSPPAKTFSAGALTSN